MAAPYSLSGYVYTVGATAKFTLRQLAAQEKIWSTVAGAFVTKVAGDIANYGITATAAVTGDKLYVGNVPTSTAGLYIAELWELAGASLALTDTLTGQPIIVNWSGTNVVSVSDTVVSMNIVYSATETVDNTQSGTIYRGQGTPIQFTADPPTAIDQDYFEGRLSTGTSSSSYIAFTVAAGNMTVNEATGVITCNPTAAQTAALSLTDPVRLELWRIGSGDDNTTLVARVKIKVVETLRGA